jgi:hypothetical protein
MTRRRSSIGCCARGLRDEMKMLPSTNNPLVIRTEFGNQRSWETICKLIREPVKEGEYEFHANVEFVEDSEFRDLTKEQLLALAPRGYKHSFLLAADAAAIGNPEFPIRVVDLGGERGRTFRAIPSQIQAIENNLSIANMSFFEFADNVQEDGVFRGFRQTTGRA